VALEQKRHRVYQERDERAVRLGEVEGALERLRTGGGVSQRVAGDRLQQLDAFDALLICGGQGPMFQDFRHRDDLKKALLHFYLARKVTATLCHGTSALLDVRLPDGTYLIDSKTITGFANVEEDFADAAVGRQMMPFRIEDAAQERGANFVQAGRFKAFAVRDGNLFTGQQQYSGRKLAELIIAALGD